MRDYYIYHRPETNQDEKVTPERWGWEARYNSGAVLKQFNDEDGSFHQLREINQPDLAVFRMVKLSADPSYSLDPQNNVSISTTHKFFDIQWHPSRKLIHFYNRNVLENGTQKITLYCFGYETFFEGASHTVLMVILPDDSMVVTEDIGRIQLT